MSLTLPVGGYAPRETSHGAGLERFRAVVAEETGGEVRLPVIWNILDLGRPVTDLFEMVEAGEMFMCYFSTSYQGHRVPELNLIEVPFMFDDLESAHASLDGPLGRVLTESVRRSTGFEMLGYWDNGFRHLTNRLRPVRRPADVVGMTIRLQPNRFHEEMIRGWGAVPVAVELQRGIELISTGGVDAQENPLANTVAYGVDQVHRFVTITGHLYGARGLFANRRIFGSLSADVRNVVTAAAASAIAHQRRLAAEAEAGLRLQLEAAGLDFVDLTEGERAEFVEASRPAIELARRDLGDDLFSLAKTARGAV
ncbi:MAG: TRAP transporter substrate-binding protein [Acidimicrobiia bacterium]